jgi:uncharacterized protein YndB with AHSA1/START domain
MKVLQSKLVQAALGLGVLLVILVGIAFFLPSYYLVEKKTVINASPKVVFSEVRDIKSWGKWNPWSERDSTMKFHPREDEKNRESFYWVGQNTDYGEIVVLDAQPQKRLWYTINFPNYHFSSAGGFELRPVQGGTEVTWSDKGYFSWNPVKRFIGLFLGKMVARDFEHGLENLKRVCEQQPR